MENHRSSAFTEPSPSPPSMVAHEVTETSPGASIQGAPNRKRTRSSTQSAVLSNNSIPPKRPPRATKETWKAKEARVALEEAVAKRSQTSSDRRRKKLAPFAPLDSATWGVAGKVADIEDNIVGEELRQRCEELFMTRYGHQELQKAVIKRQTTKK
ncbi:hypothetical protein H2202_010925 [Exophiala xenobiotica]|nr:hypothetical protein H2202_010925 [Exophiala xenobiotica]